ncbi:MAG: tetratricopeptide repeat protein [Alphaproteobacteria bacterium]|nr:tetratricopeptide repeat protein [Alphaproteobacteria bacterium]MCB9792413.1 tetratricopeptide repeat protein [Alphaproteobacteria bacterium]
MREPPPSSATAAPGVEPLRVDAGLRQHLARDPSPSRRLDLARALLAHHAAEEALSLLPEGHDLRWAALRQLGAGRPAAQGLGEPGEGEDAFLVVLHAGMEDAAERVAARTPGAEGERLRAELSLRRGQAPKGPLDPLNALRRDFLEGALRAVAERAATVQGEEAALLGAAAWRLLGERSRARASIEGLGGRAQRVLPGLPLEQALQRLQETKLVFLGATDLSALGWSIGACPPSRLGLPTLLRLRRQLRGFEAQLGPFRGELLTRCVQGRVLPVTQADDPRARAARLRASLRVQGLDEVVARIDALAARVEDPHLAPMYAAELLHWGGRYEEAGARCERVTQADPWSRWSWIGLCQAQMWTGDLAGARRTLRQLERRHPRLPTLPAVAGELALREGAPARALPLLRQAVHNHRGRWSAHVLLALALARAGEADQAARVHARLLEAAPGAWDHPGSLTDALEAQLLSLRGNRSSGFVTRLGADGEAQWLRHEALQRL